MTESATGSLNAFDVLHTTTPRRSAAAQSIESIPVPHFEITRNLGAASSTEPVIRSSPQIMPSTSLTSGRRSPSSSRSRTVGTSTLASCGLELGSIPGNHCHRVGGPDTRTFQRDMLRDFCIGRRIRIARQE